MNEKTLRPAEVARLIDSYELEVTCTACRRVVLRPIRFLRQCRQIRCDHCMGIITFEESKLQREIRRIGRQMRRLYKQLSPVVAAHEREIRKLREHPLPDD